MFIIIVFLFNKKWSLLLWLLFSVVINDIPVDGWALNLTLKLSRVRRHHTLPLTDKINKIKETVNVT